MKINGRFRSPVESLSALILSSVTLDIFVDSSSPTLCMFPDCSCLSSLRYCISSADKAFRTHDQEARNRLATGTKISSWTEAWQRIQGGTCVSCLLVGRTTHDDKRSMSLSSSAWTSMLKSVYQRSGARNQPETLGVYEDTDEVLVL